MSARVTPVVMVVRVWTLLETSRVCVVASGLGQLVRSAAEATAWNVRASMPRVLTVPQATSFLRRVNAVSLFPFFCLCDCTDSVIFIFQLKIPIFVTQNARREGVKIVDVSVLVSLQEMTAQV